MPVAGTTMAGWFVIYGASPPWGGSTPEGLNLLRSVDTGHTSTWWLGNGLGDYQTTSNPSAAIAGCNGMGNGGTWQNTSDFAKIPSVEDVHRILDGWQESMQSDRGADWLGDRLRKAGVAVGPGGDPIPDDGPDGPDR